MKKALIKEIVGINERNKGEHGPVFYITMKMDNDELITLGKKTRDAFKIGDTISYEVVEEGRRWKEVKENTFKPKFNQEANNRGAMIGMAYKLAFELTYKGEDDFQNAVVLANRIFECAMDTYNLSKENETPKNDKLPF